MIALAPEAVVPRVAEAVCEGPVDSDVAVAVSSVVGPSVPVAVSDFAVLFVTTVEFDALVLAALVVMVVLLLIGPVELFTKVS